MVKPWRNPQFSFLVTWSWGQMRCREVVGLPEVHKSGESHGGQYAEILAQKSMGGQMPGSIMLRQVTVTSDAGFQGWLQQINSGAPEAGRATVSLMFDNKPPSVVWALEGVCPVQRIEISPGNHETEVKIDRLMLAYDGVTVIKS